MNDVRIFNNAEFGEVRTVTIEGEPWFVGRDVAVVLGYAKPETALRNRVKERDTLKQGISDANGHKQQMIMINEAGLYSLVFGSKLESAERFSDWVLHEVLPSIRKTGGYSLPDTTDGKIALLAQGHVELREKIETVDREVNEVKDGFEKFKEDCPMFPVELERISNAVKKKGVECLGGKDSNAYRDGSIRRSVFYDIYGQIHRNFAVTSYKEIARKHIEDVLGVVSLYILPVILRERVSDANSQQALEL